MQWRSRRNNRRESEIELQLSVLREIVKERGKINCSKARKQLSNAVAAVVADSTTLCV